MSTPNITVLDDVCKQARKQESQRGWIGEEVEEAVKVALLEYE